MSAQEELEKLEREMREAWRTGNASAHLFADRIAAIREGLGKAQGEAVAEVVSKYGDPEAFGERELVALCDLQRIPYRTVLYSATPADSAQVLVDALEKIARVNAMDYEYQRWAREAIATHKSEVKG